MDDDFRRRLDAYPIVSEVALRYGDVDRQGHLNNVAIAGLYQEARVQILERVLGPLTPDSRIMLVEQTIRFLGEGEPIATLFGSAVARVGRSSYAIAHGMFQKGVCIGLCDSVIVNVGDGGRSAALPDDLRARLEALMLVR